MKGISKKAPQLELGLIAQEELEIEKEFGYGKTKEDMLISSINAGGAYTMKYERIIPVLINAIKELSAEVTALKVNNWNQKYKIFGQGNQSTP